MVCVCACVFLVVAVVVYMFGLGWFRISLGPGLLDPTPLPVHPHQLEIGLLAIAMTLCVLRRILLRSFAFAFDVALELAVDGRPSRYITTLECLPERLIFVVLDFMFILIARRTFGSGNSPSPSH